MSLKANLMFAARSGQEAVIGGGIFTPGELRRGYNALNERDEAIEFLKRILSENQTATQAWQAKQEARIWLQRVAP